MSKSPPKTLEIHSELQTETEARGPCPHDNPPAPLQLCVLSVPHLDDHKPHEDAAAAEVTCEGLRLTSEGGEGLLRADLSDASGGGKVCPGLRQALLQEDVVNGFNACGFWKCYYHHM